jgi:HK97 gp10 family phage protein
MASLVVTGIPEIDRKLRALGPKVGNKVVRQALRAAIKTMQAAVKQQAPHGETGELEEGTKVRAGKRSRTKIEMAVVIAGGPLVKGPRRYLYPAAVEFGARAAGIPANPFARRAFEAEKEAVKADAEKRIRDGVEREASQA